MNELAERFEITFNQIHQLLKEINGFPKNDNFVQLLEQSKRKHQVVRVYFDQLKQYAKLRNAIVHERVRGDYYIAYPHLEVVEELERIKQTFDQPPMALEFATQPVLFFKDHTPLTRIIDGFREHQISQFPIYDDEHRFLGLLTNDAVVRWMSHSVNDGSVKVEGVIASDVLKDARDHNVEFMAKDRTVYELEDRFEESLEEDRKLKAVIITQTGNRHGLPIGIVTTWDLIKVDRRNDDDE